MRLWQQNDDQADRREAEHEHQQENDSGPKQAAHPCSLAIWLVPLLKYMPAVFRRRGRPTPHKSQAHFLPIRERETSQPEISGVVWSVENSAFVATLAAVSRC